MGAIGLRDFGAYRRLVSVGHGGNLDKGRCLQRVCRDVPGASQDQVRPRTWEDTREAVAQRQSGLRSRPWRGLGEGAKASLQYIFE